MMVMEIKTMKKLLTTIIVTLLLATGAQANQEGSIDKKEAIINKIIDTFKPEIKLKLGIKVESMVIHKIEIEEFDNGSKYKVIVYLEITDTMGKHIFKTCEKSLSQPGYEFYTEGWVENQIIETKVKGKLKE